ncbi:MAG: sirohydrochlorin cobaltochelatase [Methanotrichaceae archaeon]|nr:sirohydrochlorin cobaltochelatase [Methanotrichaceae archaeon]
MTLINRSAVVLAAYGSLYPNAIATYNSIKEFYRQHFPNNEIILAFTSEFIRHKLKDRDVMVHNPLTALAELHDLGYRNILVQSLQIVPGKEFHEISSLVAGLQRVHGKFGLKRLAIGLPLLAGLDDCKKVSLALRSFFDASIVDGSIVDKFRDPSKTAVVLVGHGTGHPADSLYSMLSSVLQNRYRNVFLGTLEGYPGIDELVPAIERSGVEEIKLIPLLLVAGGHAHEDIVGNRPGSWKSILEQKGFKNDGYLAGLGERKDILQIFLDHSRNAQ